MFIFNNFSQKGIDHITDKWKVQKINTIFYSYFMFHLALLLYKIIFYLEVIVTHNNNQVSYHFKTLKKLSWSVKMISN